MERGVRTTFKAIIVLVVLATTASAQPTVITTVPNNSTNFVEAGDLVYFTAQDALWRTDGTESGTIQLGTGFNQGQLWEFEEYARHHNGYFYFVSGGSTQLWRSDGSPSGTVLLKTSSDGNVRILDATDAYVFFVASDATTGAEVHRTDGTVAGTILLKDINPGSPSGYQGAAHAVNGELFFAADNAVNGTELWKSDGSPAGTVMVKDIYPGSADGFASATTNGFSFNGQYYFQGITADEGSEPWVSDGTESGTVLLQDVEEGTPSAGRVQYEIANNGFLYFIVESEFSGPHNLWKTAGTTASTSWVREIGEEGSEQENHSFLVYKDKIYFWTRRLYFNDYLWVSDGTTAGTYTFYDIITIDGAVDFFDVANGYMLFMASAEGIPYNLYKSDGTAEGTVKAADVKARYYGIFPRDMTKIGERIYYGDHDGLMQSDGGYPISSDDYFHLFEADGDTTYSMRTLWGINTTGTDNIADLNGKVLFTTYNNEFGTVDAETKLWLYDPAVRPEATSTFTLVRSDSDQDVKRIIDGAEIRTLSRIPINIRFDPVSNPGSVVFKVNGTSVRTENGAPYSLGGDVNGDYAEWTGANPGSYTLTATVYSQPGGTGTAGESLTVTFTIPCEQGDEDCFPTGEILREQWNNAPGATVASIPLDRQPDSRRNIVKFESDQNIGDNYGTRIRGYVIAPATGDYTFWIASNDQSELWLSTDDQAGNKVKIASLTRATNSREWDKFASQQSQPISLVGGQKYYIEALHKEGVGTDHLAVGWQLPDGTLERPIPGNRLLPADPAVDPTECMASGFIVREYWNKVQGARVSDIPVDTQATGTQELSSLATPSNMGINYGTRIRGYICPPSTGDYIFYVSSNDHSELWLSADGDPANKQRVAYIEGATAPDQWDKFPSQKSSLVHLTAGHPVYVEALHKQGIGSDHFAVAWRLPDGTFEGPIMGSHLSPFSPDPASAARLANSESNAFEQISIYPNPASINDRELTIAGYEGIDEVVETRVRIMNMTGNVVHEEEVRCGGDCGSYLMKINQQLVPGLYIIEMEGGGARHSERLLVK